MPKISEATVLKRAKVLCKQDGKNWGFEFTPLPGTKIGLLFLDEAGRSEYLARAREQLAREQPGPQPDIRGRPYRRLSAVSQRSGG